LRNNKLNLNIKKKNLNWKKNSKKMIK